MTAKCPPFRYPFRLGDLWAPMWRDTLQMLDDNYQRSEAAQPEAASDNIGIGMDSPANDVDRALSAPLAELLTKLEDRDRAIEDWLEHCVGGGVGGTLRFATLVVAASNSKDLDPTHYDYLCTGTDDQVTINAALNALPAEGGRVLLMEGTYNIIGTSASGIVMPNVTQVVLEGQGPSTVIRKTVGTGLTEPLITTRNDRVQVEVRNLTLDGTDSQADDADCPGIRIRNSALIRIQNVNFRNCFKSGVLLTLEAGVTDLDDITIDHCTFTSGYSGVFANTSTWNRLVISNCIMDGISGVGIDLQADRSQARYALVSNCIVNGCLIGFRLRDLSQITLQGCQAIGASGGAGFDVAAQNASNPSENLIFIGCTAYGNGQHGFEINGTQNTILESCVASNNTGSGFIFEANQAILSDTALRNCNANANTIDGFTWSGILSQDLFNNSMMGCVARANGRWGCFVTGAHVHSTVIVNNDLHTGGGAGAFSDAGTGTILNLDGSANNWNRL